MSTTPPQRIGDAERDKAIDLLREHHAAGRLTSEEFNERMAAALTARTDADLVPLFADLPASGAEPALPMLAEPPSPTQLASEARQLPAWVMALNGIAWPAALIACFATGWQHWWIILIPGLLLPSLLGAFGYKDPDEDDELDDGDESKQLNR